MDLPEGCFALVVVVAKLVAFGEGGNFLAGILLPPFRTSSGADLDIAVDLILAAA